MSAFIRRTDQPNIAERRDFDGMVTAQCLTCRVATVYRPDKGLSRATYATWRTRHQHPEESN